ncbi:MAG TPA: NADH-quinone oxidoreductase subunit NuoG [Dongiaceae bacterium]|jgi:NADH-quinone oxidoreductase subunit G|nr:NADH-quinone oxidoreductase subunit NuoG [Dongiaceae bacterium]
MPKMKIDDIEIDVPAGITVLQACEMAGKEIPRFCYHERLSIAGNCRMCLVEQEKAPKPIASCAMPVAEGMSIRTDSPVVRKARKGVMEFLLINHPLDCPICDQGGECDLQDQAMAYGFDRSRYRENKRAVPDKNFGPIVKTAMNRCIHCTRCIRFSSEVAGVELLGAVHRGEHMEVVTYLEEAINSELSGNLIDLCPVGALTSKPYAFIARPWELAKTDSIDVMDAVGSNTRIDARDRRVLRILPRIREDINEEWLADKARYIVDGLHRQRLDQPYLRRHGKLEPASWEEAFAAIAGRFNRLDGHKIAAIAGDLVEMESVFALKQLMGALGSTQHECRQDGAQIDPRVPASHLFNTTIAGIEQADACLIVGSNPRWEAPLVNARLRKRYLHADMKVGLIGERVDLTYRTDYLGAGPETLQQLAEGKHGFLDLLAGAKHPMMIVGSGALARPDGAAILALARRVAEKANLVREGWNGFNYLERAAGRLGALAQGFYHAGGVEDILAKAQSGDIEAVYLLGADEIDTARLGSAFVIYQGHHGDRGAHRADVILPGFTFAEKDGHYMNIEGRIQRARRAVFGPGDSREDWKILRALSDALGHALPFDSYAALLERMHAASPQLDWSGVPSHAPWQPFGQIGAASAQPFRNPIINYYMTDPISRASETMAYCTEEFVNGKTRTGTHG